MTTKRTPVWKSIETALLHDIAAARYTPGDKLPTETALSHRFGVNRHTVRRALASLADQGVVHARRGAGVFVTLTPTDYPIGRRVRFHHNLQAAGHLPERRMLSAEARGADAREAEALNLPQGTPLHVCDGLSLSDGQPIAVFRSAFPAERFADMPAVLGRVHSVTRAFAEHGIADYTRAWTRLTARLASATQALHLKIREGDAILRTDAVNIDPDGTPIEYGRTWFAGDRVTLTLSAES